MITALERLPFVAGKPLPSKVDVKLMTLIDGSETYEQIISKHPNQKAIMVSGFSETKRVKKAQQLGAGIYVKKPYTIERIGIAVKAELEKEKKAA